jgi:Domain of unknown function (DUF4166)/Saccharopine dehydrogenase NADP binding domain
MSRNAGAYCSGAYRTLRDSDVERFSQMNAPLKVLIIGGYGTFGGRLVALLEDEPRLTLIVAGRSSTKAQAFCRSREPAKATLVPLAFDRGGDLDAQFATLRPDILVDASGPFQAYGERPYRVIEACIANGIDYLDLADGSEFLVGVGRYDAAAKAAGRSILSGVSTCPVLTAAVTRRLSHDMVRVESIRAGISPSPFARVGENVVRAIAAYAGRRVALRRNGVAGAGYSFTEQMHFTIAPPGRVPLRNTLFSLVDVPDLRALPELWPEAQTVWIGAGPVPEILHRLLIALAWLVRMRLLPGLSLFAPFMSFATNHLRWGEHRGGMFVEVRGADAAGAALIRSWHLLAEGDDGPFIPSMAAAALVRKMLDGHPPLPGARAALCEVELEDYERQFSARSIATGIRDDASKHAPHLYAQILGPAWDELPAEIRAMHTIDRVRAAEGRASVERGTSILARLAAWIVGFPCAAADTPVTVRFDAANGVETWTRTFGNETFSSRQFAGRGRWDRLLCEQFGPLTFAMALVREDTWLRLVLRGWSIFGVRLPMWLCLRMDAFETVEDGRFRFHVEVGHRLTGLIVRYRGWLVPAQ